jgi:hypothetical protein
MSRRCFWSGRGGTCRDGGDCSEFMSGRAGRPPDSRRDGGATVNHCGASLHRADEGVRPHVCRGGAYSGPYHAMRKTLRSFAPPGRRGVRPHVCRGDTYSGGNVRVGTETSWKRC